MAKRKQPKTVATLTHDEASRVHIPTSEYQAVLTENDRSPIRVAYERRNPDLDPQLVWRGKDVLEWSDVVVQAPPLFIQEKVHPKVLIDDLVQRSRDIDKDAAHPNLFAYFNGLPSEARTEFYQHAANWSNRMILGDSLQVMASLTEREGLRGKVQCIYIDPPYGINFNSNFQWSTTSRDVKDGKTDHVTREPEQVKAFRDTWRDGIHSFLTYIRDRLTVARDLLTESGSIFFQIGDENVHRVRTLMDEVFGEKRFVSQISFAKTTGFSGDTLANVSDHILWYAKEPSKLKYRPLWLPKTAGKQGAKSYKSATRYHTLNGYASVGTRLVTLTDLTSQGASQHDKPIVLRGRVFPPRSHLHWKTNTEGIRRLKYAERVAIVGTTLSYIRFLDDFGVFPLVNNWSDTVGQNQFGGKKVYVVQTALPVIKRCILMSTDPGDLVLDPTCGSGTTAYVAEQWGRRWITIDTSRVALALARARLMGARYPYYLLADSSEGQRKQAEIERKIPSEDPPPLRRCPTGLRVPAGTAHHSPCYRQQHRDRRHI